MMCVPIFLGPYETALIALHCNSAEGAGVLPLVQQSGLLVAMTVCDARRNVLVPKAVIARIDAPGLAQR